MTGQGSQWQINASWLIVQAKTIIMPFVVAYDNKGNASKRVQTEVVITGAARTKCRSHGLTLDGQSRIQMSG
ncbi:hypothetical protein ACLB1O_17645 [Escherichia coli]